MEYITYKMIEISKLNSGGDRPKIYSDIKTNECCFPIFSNGLQDEGLYGYTNKAIMPSDTITVSARGANIGEVFYRKEDFLPIVRLITIIPDSNYVHSKYLYYYLKKVKIEGSGSAQPQITVPFFSRHKIVIPKDVEYQKKVADILSTYDNLIENNNKRIKLLEQMAENLYKEWFVRFRFPGYEDVEFESGIPKGWEILRANQLFDITIGKTPDRKIFEYFSNIPECNYPWISISDMRSASTFLFKTKEYLTINAVNTCNVKIIPKNTVIVSFKLTVGQVAITTSDMCTNEAIAHFTTDNDAMREYIYLYLKKFQYSDLGNTSSIGTAVNSKIIKNMKIILPSSELLNRFHDSVYSIFEEIRLLNETNNNLIKQRDMLLPRLMSGKLEV